MRKTKIVCTLGPSTDKGDVLRQLIENGMNVARFNFSHGDYDEHRGRFEQLKALRTELGKPIAAMLDTKGPEIRIKSFDVKKIDLEAGNTFTLTTADEVGNAKVSNMVMLGAYVAGTKILKPETIEAMIQEMFAGPKAKFIPLNIEAFRRGMACIQ